MELIVLRFNDKYLRETDEGYELVGMNKASVYPLSDKKKVIEIFERFKPELEELELRMLEIIEKEYRHED